MKLLRTTSASPDAKPIILGRNAYRQGSNRVLKAVGPFPLPEKRPSARNGQSLASQNDLLAKIVWKGGAPYLALLPVPLNPDILSPMLFPGQSRVQHPLERLGMEQSLYQIDIAGNGSKYAGCIGECSKKRRLAFQALRISEDCRRWTAASRLTRFTALPYNHLANRTPRARDPLLFP